MYQGITNVARFDTRVSQGIYPTKHTLGIVFVFPPLLRPGLDACSSRQDSDLHAFL